MYINSTGSMKDIDIFNIYKSFQDHTLTKERIKDIRILYRSTQKEFSKLLGIKFETYKKWEKGQRHPSSPASTLLLVAESYPKLFLDKNSEIVKKIRTMSLFL